MVSESPNLKKNGEETTILKNFIRVSFKYRDIGINDANIDFVIDLTSFSKAVVDQTFQGVPPPPPPPPF